jgi:hypothetical protein
MSPLGEMMCSCTCSLHDNLKLLYRGDDDDICFVLDLHDEFGFFMGPKFPLLVKLCDPVRVFYI